MVKRKKNKNLNSWIKYESLQSFMMDFLILPSKRDMKQPWINEKENYKKNW